MTGRKLWQLAKCRRCGAEGLYPWAAIVDLDADNDFAPRWDPMHGDPFAGRQALEPEDARASTGLTLDEGAPFGDYYDTVPRELLHECNPFVFGVVERVAVTWDGGRSRFVPARQYARIVRLEPIGEATPRATQ